MESPYIKLLAEQTSFLLAAKDAFSQSLGRADGVLKRVQGSSEHPTVAEKETLEASDTVVLESIQYGQELLNTVDRLLRYSQDKGYLS